LLPIVASSARAPTLTQVSPPRPRAGDIVRVYGTGFDAINGNTLPPDCGNAPARNADFCDPSEPDLAQINRSTNGNRLRLSMGGQSRLLDLVAVTPTMLAFRMPVDCFAPATIELRRGSRTIGVPACDAAGCSGQPAGVACADEGNACTTDVCDGAGTCVHQALPRGTECRPAVGPCDVTEVCDGTGSQCPPDGKRAADDVCRAATGPCDHPESCDGIGDQCPDDRLEDTTHVCRPPAGPCDVVETCDGVSVACPADVVRPAGAVCRASQDQCDPAETCDGIDATCPADTQASGFDAIGCRLNTLDGIADQGCRPTRPITVALTKATSTLQRAQEACAARRVRPARRILRRRVSQILRRLDKLVSADPCLRGAGGRLTVTAAREQVPALVQLLPTLCR